MAHRELQLLSDEVWERTRDRLDGLTDDEYFWEPAPGCWSIRWRWGQWFAEGARPGPTIAPPTTIAWRLWHLIDMYGEDRAPRWLDVEPQGTAIGLDDPEGQPPGTAAEALSTLARAHARWDAHLGLVGDDDLTAPIGPVGGAFAERTRHAYVLHMLDEFIHHGAEIALLRDLWRWDHPLDPEPHRDRIMRGEIAVVDDVLDDPDPRSHAEALLLAAGYGRWELVRALVGGGVSPNTGGRTPLHSAAVVGDRDVVELLLEHGADPSAKDPEFDAAPAQWAEFAHHEAIAARLREAGGT